MSGSRRIWIAGGAACLLMLLPFGNFVKTNYGDGSFISVSFVRFFLETAAFVIASVAALAGLLYLSTFRRAPHSFSRAIVATSSAFFLLFSYHHPYLLLFPETIDNWVPASSYLVVVGLSATLLFMLAKHSAVLVAVLVFATANAALTLPSIARMTVDATRTMMLRNADTEVLSVATTDPKPNVYYFILDAYSSVSSLRRNLGYENAPFISAMEERGFYHAEGAISSYNRTVFTLASIFAQDYFATSEMTLTDGSRLHLTFPSLLNAPYPPSLVADARSQGYEFYLVGNYWAPCAGPWVSCYAEAQESAYLADVFWSATPARALVATVRGDETREVPDVDAIGKLRQRLKEKGAPKVPTFTFVHHLSPHAPYIFHADCSLRDEYELDLQGWPEEAKPYFLDNLKCVNAKAARIADEIAAVDPNSIVVFQGDHGTSFTVGWDRPFDEWQPSWVHERSSILNLIRLPEKCRSWLAQDLDNVTTVRAVMGCVSGREATRIRPRGYVNTFSKENPDHGKSRLIDPLSFRLMPEGVRDRPDDRS